MSARRESQSIMPGLAQRPASVTLPPRPISVAEALFSPIPQDNDTCDIHIHGGTFYRADNIALNHHNHYVQNASSEAFLDPTGALRRWTNEGLRVSPQSISSQRTPETGKIFQSQTQFRSWWEVVNSVLWASGIPGAGKTFLASAIFDDVNDIVRTSLRDACTVIYLKHNDQWTTWDIVSFIIIDLVESKPLPAALEAIRGTLGSQRSGSERPSLSDLVALLQKIVKLYGRCYILIDGVDEMKAEIQVDLIRIIAKLEANVLLTSRPLKLVQDQLETISYTKPVFTTVAAENEDLRLYIEDTIDRTPTFASLLDNSFPKEQLIKKIQTKASGMFLHAMLQMEALRHCITQEELLELLDQFPPGIDPMYAETVRRIERQHPSHVAFAKTALLWLVHANGSMSIDDLRCATATVAPDYHVEPKRMLTEDNLLTICCGLVTVDAKTRQARLIHDTARDALRSLLSEHCSKPQAMMATACLTRLLQFGFHESSATYDHELEDVYANAPLLRYAHHAIQHHVQRGVKEDPGLISSVEQFIRLCSSFPYPDPWNWGIHGLTTLHMAVLFNQQPMVETFLNNGAGDVNDKTSFELGGISPLAIAALEGLHDLTEYLLSVPDIRANDGELTPLMCAAIRGQEKVVEQLLLHLEEVAKGQGDHGPPRLDMEVNCVGRSGRTALGFAAFEGHAAAVKLLLGVEGVDINKGEDSGWTPLLNASQEGHVEVVKLFLSAPGTDVNQTANDGASPLFVASNQGHIEVVKLLLNAHGINVNQAMSDGASPLLTASNRGHVEVVKLILDVPGINANQAMNDGASPLLTAADQGHVEVVKLLLNAPGIDKNQPWNTGASPLFQASQNGHVEVVRLLLSSPGIDVNQAMSNGASPLYVASQNGRTEVVKMLLGAPGIDANQTANDGVSPLSVASQNGHTDIVGLLLKVPGIDIAHEDSYGDTALTLASTQGHNDIVQMLSAALRRSIESLEPPTSLNAVSNDAPHAGHQSAMGSPKALSQAHSLSPPLVAPADPTPSVPSQPGHIPAPSPPPAAQFSTSPSRHAAATTSGVIGSPLPEAITSHSPTPPSSHQPSKDEVKAAEGDAVVNRTLFFIASVVVATFALYSMRRPS